MRPRAAAWSTIPPGLLHLDSSRCRSACCSPKLAIAFMETKARLLFAALEALDVSVDVDGTAVTAITAHFESKLISYAGQRELVSDSQFAPNDEDERYRYAAYALYRSTGAALTIRDRLNTLLAGNSGEPDPAQGLGPEQAVVFCGDVNDQLDAATTQIIQDPSGSEIGTAGFKSAYKGDGYRLWNRQALAIQLQAAEHMGVAALLIVFKEAWGSLSPSSLPPARAKYLSSPPCQKACQGCQWLCPPPDGITPMG